MATALSLIIQALKTTEDEITARVQALEEKLEHQATLSRIRSLKSYYKRRAILQADPNYIKPKNGRPFKTIAPAEEKF